MVGLLLCLIGGAASAQSTGTDGAASAGSTPSGAQTSAPSGGFFSSLTQALRQDLTYDVVRGHVDVGSPPSAHRLYCLLDTRTGKNEVNAVTGEPFVRPDGMTGIKSGAVSPLSCVTAEQQGTLVTAGYVLNVTPKDTTNVPATAPPAPRQAERPPAESAKNVAAPDKIDVAGVKLGMSPEQVRAVLKSKMLSEYYESTESLGGVDPAKRRFVNVIASWTSVPGQDGESYMVMFTPTPGRERVMAVVHSVAYSSADAIGSSALQTGLVKKYGGYSAPDGLPESPTWRIQSDGNVLTGDTCDRREVFGGLAEMGVGTTTRQNLALRTTPEEFRFQIDHCGVAIVTEDHTGDRIITRFTVSAYSPSIGLEGATTAAQLMQAAGSPAAKPQTPPNL
jgi:hypothetical protein